MLETFENSWISQTEKMHLLLFHLASLYLKEWMQQQNSVKWVMN